MLEDLTAIACAQGDYLFRHQLNAMGVSDARIRQACAARLLVRVRHGVYVPHDLWATSSAEGRHAIVARAMLDKLGPGVVASHLTAAVLHGLDVWNVDLSSVHLTRLDGGSGRHEAGVVFHENALDPTDVDLVDGRAVSCVRRAVLETASTVGVEQGMVVVSSALRRESMSHDLEGELGDIAHWPGARHARLTIRLSDGRLESVGEVRSLYLMWQYGIPRPELQQEVVLPDGGRARLDFHWAQQRHCGEFDGEIKLGALNSFGAGDVRALAAEKRREDAVRSTRRGVSRWGWVDLSPGRRRETAARIAAAIEQSERLYGALSAR